MIILAFDCSTSCLYGAIAGTDRPAMLSVELGLKHQEELLPLLEQLCTLAGTRIEQVQGIVCGKGPGSFTGLRVAMASAKALACALGQPLVSISLLDAMAAGVAVHPERSNSPAVLAVLDARRERFYGAWYHNGRRQDDYHDLSLTDWAALARQRPECSHGIVVCGPDAASFTEGIRPLAPDYAWSASTSGRGDWPRLLLELGRERIDAGNWDSVDEGPEYVRNSDADLGIVIKKDSPPGTGPAAGAT